jgi:hypothetical protein
LDFFHIIASDQRERGKFEQNKEHHREERQRRGEVEKPN